MRHALGGFSTYHAEPLFLSSICNTVIVVAASRRPELTADLRHDHSELSATAATASNPCASSLSQHTRRVAYSMSIDSRVHYSLMQSRRDLAVRIRVQLAIRHCF